MPGQQPPIPSSHLATRTRSSHTRSSSDRESITGRGRRYTFAPYPQPGDLEAKAEITNNLKLIPIIATLFLNLLLSFGLGLKEDTGYMYLQKVLGPDFKFPMFLQICSLYIFKKAV